MYFIDILSKENNVNNSNIINIVIIHIILLTQYIYKVHCNLVNIMDAWNYLLLFCSLVTCYVTVATS